MNTNGSAAGKRCASPSRAQRIASLLKASPEGEAFAPRGSNINKHKQSAQPYNQ
jgi:hypothetical protein